jgi:transposase
MQSSYRRLTDAQWEFIKHFLNWQRKRELKLRDIFDAILYVTRTGVQWRNLNETNFPDWQAVYYYFRKWKNNGNIVKLNLALNKFERLQKGRKVNPSLAFVDSQSIKAGPFVSDRGIDGNKKINGRKRHILTDILGRIYETYIHPANFHDSPQGVNLLNKKTRCIQNLSTIMGDKTYRGTFAKAVEALNIKFEIPDRPENTKGFVVEAKRWVVERTFAWLNFYRRLTVDHEKTVESSMTFILLANISMIIPLITLETK